MDRYRILVAEDNPSSRLLLKGALQKAGYEVLETDNGLDAVNLARTESLDLVLLDVEMPGRDGLEVCSMLREEASTAGLPVIFITSRADSVDIEHAFSVGGSDYVTKPFHMKEVKARVSVHLQLRRALRRLEESHTQLLQAQKLESIGQLAAGIAHEINTPTQYVGDNIRFLQDGFGELVGLVERAQELVSSSAGEALSAERIEAFREACRQADVEFLREEIPKAIEQSIDGVGRVTRIVRAMKEFSHPGVSNKTNIDLNKAIESTVTVARNEWKYVAEMELDFQDQLPHVNCLPGELNQVVLNIVVNAAHAIADVVGDGSAGKGRITIRTRQVGNQVEIRIEDTGTGIPESVRRKIFDPFFTTKEVGRGTGQGLSIAHSVIVEKHDGTIDFETADGKGTTFVIRLPIRQSAREREEAA